MRSSKELDIEEELAVALGWTEIMEDDTLGEPNLFGTPPDGGEKGPIPRWTRDDAEAFKLAYDNEIGIEWDDAEGIVLAIYGHKSGDSMNLKEPMFFAQRLAAGDKGVAVRAAIANARIQQLASQ
jgi:hypothetical protein